MRVVQHDLRAVLGLDDDVGLGQPALEVAALVAARLVQELLALDGLVRVEERLQHLPVDLDQLDRGPRLRVRVRRDGGDRRAHVAGLVGERVEVVRARAPRARRAPPAPARGRCSRTRARACGLRRMAACSMPGKTRSAV